MMRVGRHEIIIIIFLLMTIKYAGSALKVRVGRVSGNTAIFVIYALCENDLLKLNRLKNI